MANQLPEDVIVEILCLLPIKCVVVWKCVSKAWDALISNVCVPRMLREPAPLCGFLFERERLNLRQKSCMDYSFYPDDFIYEGREKFVESYSRLLPSQYSQYHVLDSCNGLILLVNVSGGAPHYFVCNPATKQCVSIPKSDLHVDQYHAGLAFNPCESTHYKVVRFVYNFSCSESNPVRLDIFSSQSGEWVRHLVPIQPPVVYGVRWTEHCVYWDGMMYKLTYSNHLLCFNLKTLTAQAIEVPDKDRFETPGFIGVSRGVLHYANHNGDKMEIWQFDYHRKEGFFWIPKHVIVISDFIDKYGDAHEVYRYRFSPMFMPYAIHPTDDIIILGIPFKTLEYNLKSGELRIHSITYSKIARGQYSYFPYARCFMGLKDFSKTDSKSP